MEELVTQAEAKRDELREDGIINKFTRLFIKRCPKCDGRLDYNHIGYKGDRAYCHNCKWRSDGEFRKI